MLCRGIRGATVAASNTKTDILAATRELLHKMIEANQVEKEAVASVLFTMTSDLDAEFPAVAARELGWTEEALVCSQEISVPGSLPRCIRILILVNTDKKSDEIKHVYIRGAEVLRQPPEGRGEQP
jgi:chorismate mutase